MPLKDHFQPPVWKQASWEGFHGTWPAVMVQELNKVLPEKFSAEPRVHLGTFYEIDVCAFEGEGYEQRAARLSQNEIAPLTNSGAALATLTAIPPKPTLDVDADFTEEYAYEVLIFDQSRGRHLVAAVEIVSPANKDRPESRQLFAAKCAALLQKQVCVSIVDLVTIRRFNLYAELLDLVHQSDPTLPNTPPSTYAATCRRTKTGERTRFQTWAFPLHVGDELPKLPIWLSDDLWVDLDLEASYETACQVLRIH
jgi:hypothetical protein